MSPEVQSGMLAAVSALVAGLLTYWGTLKAARLQSERAGEIEAQARLDESRFTVFLKLSSLNAQYWWLSVAEHHGQLEENDPTNIRGQCYKLASELADDVRRAAKLEETEEILDILFNEERYPSFRERSDAMNALEGRLIETMSPRFSKKMQGIWTANVRKHYKSGNEAPKTAPMSFDLLSENIRRMEIKQRRAFEAIRRGEEPPDDDD